jgi:histidyl-tRNA synthetase
MLDISPSERARGMRDLLPDDMARLRLIEDAFRRTCTLWGYREVRTPVIEPLHLFTAAGTLSPRTLDRVYSFLDWDGWSGERVVLRPDSTIPAARLYSESLDGGRIAKLFYTQNVFRFAEDDAPREQWQCGVELVGDTGRAGDVEIVLLAVDALAAAGLPAPRVRLSHAAVVREVLAAAGLGIAEQSAAYDRLLDGDRGVVDEIEARLPQLNAPLRLLFGVAGEGGGYVANVRSALVSAIPALASPLDELAFVVAALEARGIAPMIETVLTRSFEYYSGIVMKVDVNGRRAAIGGRYDNLIGVVGRRPVPASGFALYVEQLADLVAAPSMLASAVTVEVAERTPECLALAFEAAARLRASGLRVETTPGGSAHKRLVCSTGAPRYVLRSSAGEREFDSLDAMLRAVGGAR